MTLALNIHICIHRTQDKLSEFLNMNFISKFMLLKWIFIKGHGDSSRGGEELKKLGLGQS